MAQARLDEVADFMGVVDAVKMNGAKLLQARPDTAVASQEGDQTVLAATIAIPAR